MAYWAETIENNTQPLVLAVPEMTDDAEAKFRATHFMGSLAINGWEAAEQLPGSSFNSLYEANRAAHDGDSMGRAMVKANVSSDVIERTIKTGMILEVEQEVYDGCQVAQHGQVAEAIQANSLRLTSPLMRPRVEAETRNSFRIKQALKAGYLNDYCFVVFSRAADNMTTDQMADEGFFTDTMSTAIQLTTLKNGKLVTESAFVAGVKQRGGERHDEQTIVAVGQQLGVDFASKTAAEIIDTPLLVHKSLLPEGVLDLVAMYDQAAGDTFFGEDRPRQDYRLYKRHCRERQQTFEPKIEKIVQQLVDEAPFIASPLQAVKRLHELSQAEMVEHAIRTDTDIDPMVFGYPAAVLIEQGRLAAERGDYGAAQNFTNLAKRNARSDSCPGVGKGSDSGKSSEGSDANEESDNEPCEFVSQKCPKCGAKKVKTVVTKTQIKGACGCTAKLK